MGAARRGWGGAGATVAVAALCGLAYLGIVLYNYDPDTFLVGDCPYYAAAAVSLLGDHDLKLRNNLRGQESFHATFVALGADGEWRPKHPVLLSAASIPFLLAFGVKGLLLLNVLVLTLLVAAAHRLALRAAPAWAASVATAITGLLTFVIAYAYNYSPDAFAALPAVAALLMLWAGRPVGAGLLAGAAFAAKPAHLLFLVLALGAAAAKGGTRGALRFAAGAAPWFVAVLIYNQVLFGGPLTFGYDRIFDPGAPGGMVSQRQDFSLAAVPQNLAGQIVDQKRGLAPTAPSALLALAGLPFLWRRDRILAFLCGALAVAYLAFFATFLPWMASQAGNRYLFIPVVLSAVPLAALLDRLGRIGAPVSVGAGAARPPVSAPLR